MSARKYTQALSKCSELMSLSFRLTFGCYFLFYVAWFLSVCLFWFLEMESYFVSLAGLELLHVAHTDLRLTIVPGP